MDDTIRYRTTDLDLISIDDLTALAAALKRGGVPPLHVTHGQNRLWYATFAVGDRGDQYAEREPEQDIAAMLSVVESLSEPLLSAWRECIQRELNIGYDCGSKPWAFNQELSSQLLGRISAAVASLRITIYPDARSEAGSS